MAVKKRKASTRKRSSKKENSLVANINRRKRARKSRPKSRTTVSRKAYGDMQDGWTGTAPKKKKGTKKKKKTQRSR